MGTNDDLMATACKSAWEPIKFCLNFCCTRGDYFYGLEKNLPDLEEKLKSLQGLKENIETEHKDTPRTQQQARKMTRWLDRVNRSQKKAKETRKEAEEEIKNMVVRWFFPNHCCSFTGLILKELDKLIEEGENLESELDAVRENYESEIDAVRPVDERPIVGLYSLVNHVLGYVGKPSVQIIGLHDMEGAGKNTLLKVINKRLNDNAYLVIRVEMAGEKNIGKVQEAIIRKLKISDEVGEDKSVEERSFIIHEVLEAKRSVLLLDDLADRWEPLDLLRNGIPLDGSGNVSCVIFTAPPEAVCKHMKVDAFVGVVELLTPHKVLMLSKRPNAPLPPDMAKLAALSEGPITVGLPVVNWVTSEDSRNTLDEPWLNRTWNVNNSQIY